MTPKRPVALGALCVWLLGCGRGVDLGGRPDGDAGSPVDGTVANCPGFAPPDAPADCTACFSDCQPNGCYNGWYCRLSTRDCLSPESSCGD